MKNIKHCNELFVKHTLLNIQSWEILFYELSTTREKRRRRRDREQKTTKFKFKQKIYLYLLSKRIINKYTANFWKKTKGRKQIYGSCSCAWNSVFFFRNVRLVAHHKLVASINTMITPHIACWNWNPNNENTDANFSSSKCFKFGFFFKKKQKTCFIQIKSKLFQKNTLNKIYNPK